MSNTQIWFGGIGGGVGGSFIVGGSAYVMLMHNLDSLDQSFMAMISGKRLGLTAQIEASHALCLMTGVKSGQSVTKIQSSGADWAVSIGAKLDGFLKAGGKIANELLTLLKVTKDIKPVPTALLKQQVHQLCGDFGLFGNEPAYYMIPTTGPGLGVGFWYEWQTFERIQGNFDNYRWMKPQWQLSNEGGSAPRLMIRSMPEPNGATRRIFLEIDSMGYNEPLMMDRVVGGCTSSGDGSISFKVQNGEAYDLYDGKKGIALGNQVVTGYKDKTWLGSSVLGDKVYFNASNRLTTFPVRIRLFGHLVYDRWYSSQAMRIRTDVAGRIVTVPNGPADRWAK